MAGVKANKGKPMMSLLPPRAKLMGARAFSFGAEKYGKHNWMLGLPYSELYDALERHMTAFWSGEDLDPESGLPHMAHAIACVMMLAETAEMNKDYDDRPSTLTTAEMAMTPTALKKELESHAAIKIEELLDDQGLATADDLADAFSPSLHPDSVPLQCGNFERVDTSMIEALEPSAPDHSLEPTTLAAEKASEFDLTEIAPLPPVVKGTPLKPGKISLQQTPGGMRLGDHILPPWVVRGDNADPLGYLLCTRCNTSFPAQPNLLRHHKGCYSMATWREITGIGSELEREE